MVFSLRNTYINIKTQRDEAREDSKKGAYEWCELHLKLRDAENELYIATEKLQDADSDMDDERKEFRDASHGLKDQHLADQEEIRSLKQDLWNSESDRDGHSRQAFQVLKENQKLKDDLSGASIQYDLAQAQMQTLRENMAEVSRQRDLAEEKVRTLSTQVEHQQGQVTYVTTSLKARPKPQHRRTQRPSSLPKFHKKKLLVKRSNPARASTSSSARPISPRDDGGKHLPKGTLQAILAEENLEIKDFQGRSEPSKVQAGAEAEQMSGEKTPEVLELDASVLVRDQEIRDLEEEKWTLNAEISGLRTELKNSSGEHLRTQLAGKNEEISNLQAEKTTADNHSAETLATLQTKLEEEEKKVAHLEEANGTSAAELTALSNELQASRLTHAHCNENSTSQESRIGQLEEKLREKDSEIWSLQKQATELVELQDTHARCGEHASTQGLETSKLSNANELLQRANGNLSQELGKVRDNHANLVQQHQLELARNQELLHAGRDLQSTSQREIYTLQHRINGLNQTVDSQQQSIQTLETNCPKCQKLREALDAVTEDVDMSKEEARAEMKREVTEELRSQAADGVRRQVKNDIERGVRKEYQTHYSDLLERNSKRIQEQDRLLLEKEAELERAKMAPVLNHAACEKKAASLQSTITTLRQDAKIAKENHSRLRGEAQRSHQQLEKAHPATENLKSELESIKADQRRAQNLNPLQSKLTTCQRELEKMKDERNKARDNCSIYSKQLQELRKEHKALHSERLAFREKGSLDGDSLMEDGRTEKPIAVPNEWRKAASTTSKGTVSTLQKEVARLSKELEEQKAGDNGQNQSMGTQDTTPADQSLIVGEREQQWHEGRFPDDQSSGALAPATDRHEAAALNVLRHEVEVREARDGKAKAGCTQLTATACLRAKITKGGLSQSPAQDSDDADAKKPSSLIDRAQDSDDEREEVPKPASKPAGRVGRRPGRLPKREPTTKADVREGAGMKRGHDDFSDGEADDEGLGGDERKRVKIAELEDGMHRLKATGDASASTRNKIPHEDKEML